MNNNKLVYEGLIVWRISSVGAFLALSVIFCLAQSPMLKSTVTETYQSSVILVSIAYSVFRLKPLFKPAVNAVHTQKVTLAAGLLTLLYGYVLNRFVYIVF